jgi:hypothetical protein
MLLTLLLLLHCPFPHKAKAKRTSLALERSLAKCSRAVNPPNKVDAAGVFLASVLIQKYVRREDKELISE